MYIESMFFSLPVILFCLHNAKPQVKFFNLKTDIYPFVDAHYDLLCCAKTGMFGYGAQWLWRTILISRMKIFQAGLVLRGRSVFKTHSVTIRICLNQAPKRREKVVHQRPTINLPSCESVCASENRRHIIC